MTAAPPPDAPPAAPRQAPRHPAPFERHVAPARARPQLWRVLGGLVLVVVVYVALFVAILALAVPLLAPGEGLAGAMLSASRGDDPRAVLVVLATFAGLMIGPLLAARLLHRRSGRSLFGRPLWRPFGVAAAATAAVYLLSLLLPRSFDPVPGLAPAALLPLLPLAIAGLLVQTGAEEVLFRGYLQSQLAARFRSPVAWMVLPSLLFGLLHLDPTAQGPNTGWIVAATTLFGLVAADLTRVTGSIGAAWGFHLANNVFALLVLALDGPLSGLALYVTPFDGADTATLRPLIAQDMAFTVLVWATIRLWLARRPLDRSDRTPPAPPPRPD